MPTGAREGVHGVRENQHQAWAPARPFKEREGKYVHVVKVL
jgi:hypothetical protein